MTDVTTFVMIVTDVTTSVIKVTDVKTSVIKVTDVIVVEYQHHSRESASK